MIDIDTTIQNEACGSRLVIVPTNGGRRRSVWVCGPEGGIIEAASVKVDGKAITCAMRVSGKELLGSGRTAASAVFAASASLMGQDGSIAKGLLRPTISCGTSTTSFQSVCRKIRKIKPADTASKNLLAKCDQIEHIHNNPPKGIICKDRRSFRKRMQKKLEYYHQEYLNLSSAS